MKKAAGVAQSVEQLICNQQVAGSSPIASSHIWEFYLEGYPSGQREQTVNLPAQPTEVRILPPPPGIESNGNFKGHPSMLNKNGRE